MNYKHLLLPLLAGTFWLGAIAQPKGKQSFQSSGLHFIENKGQVRDQHQQARPDIDFKLRAANGLNLFIGAGQLHYQFVQPLFKPEATHILKQLLQEETGTQDAPEQRYALYRMDVELIGANPNAQVIREAPQNYYKRYFLPQVNTTNDNDGVIARSFQKVTYKNVYPDIDWVFYFNAQGRLEHDFIVHPDGNISDIKMQYNGSTALNLQDDGSLQALTPLGKIVENTPYAYTQDGKPVASAFVLEGNVLSFKTDDYTGTLIIDPVIEWGTYLGGTGDEEAGDITTDAWGNVYLCGTTTSISNIATTGAFQDTLTGNDDAFLSKWNEGGELIWATYYGGQSEDVGKGVVCDATGNVYLGGSTQSTEGIATQGVFQDTLTLGNDAFLTKFDSSGSRLWGTYLGGSNHDADVGFGMANDQSGNIYLTGEARSTDFPVTPGTHQTIKAGSSSGRDAFIAKFDTVGSLIWSTFYGGDGHDYPYALAIDALGNPYITGYTQSPNGIATPGAFQISHAGDQDAFLAKFDSMGQQVWGTYFGSSEIDFARALAVDDSKVVIAGGTTSLTGIASVNAFQGNHGGGFGDGLIAAFNLDGQRLWSSYYGGSGEDDLNGGVRCADDGGVYVVGSTTSDTGIATPGSLNNTLVGLADICLIKMNENGQRAWGTYLGGADLDYEARMTLGGLANLYITGKTNSANNISTSGSYQVGLGGGMDAFVMRINDCEAPNLSEAIQGAIEVCSGTDQMYTITPDTLATEYVWLLPGGWMGESDSNSISTLVGNAGGAIQVVAISACRGVSDTQTLSVTVHPSPEPEIQENDLILSTTQPYESYQWLLDGQDIAGATDPIYLAEADGYYQVRVRNAGNCTGTADSLLVEGVSGIEPLDKVATFRLYPNPSSGYLFLDSERAGFIQCFNLEGKQMMALMRFNVGLNRFDVAYLPAGMYLFRVTTDEENWTLKWVKK